MKKQLLYNYYNMKYFNFYTIGTSNILAISSAAS